MRQRKMFELFRGLNTRQWKRFGDFLRSPYFNRQEEIVRLYEYLEHAHPHFEDVAVLWENPPGFLKPTEMERHLAQLTSQMTTLCTKFLAVDELEKDQLAASYLTLQALKGNDDLFEKTIRKAEKDLLLYPRKSINWYKAAFDLSWLNLELAGSIKPLDLPHATQDALDNLDRFHAGWRMRLLLHIASQKHILSVDFYSIFPDMSVDLPEKMLLEEPLLAVYQHALKFTLFDDPVYFDMLLEALERYEPVLTKEDVKNLYACALNFCTRRINVFNEQKYYEKYLKINDILLNTDLLAEGGFLPSSHFLNIVSISVKTERWEYAKDFINRWKHHLPPEHAENLANYCLALWHYSQGQYDQAQKKLALVELNDVQLSLAARSLIIKIYVETNQTELLLPALEATRIYLLRATHIEAKKRKQMQQFVDFTRRLMKIFPRDREKLKALADKMPPPEQVLHRDWLLGQIVKKMG